MKGLLKAYLVVKLLWLYKSLPLSRNFLNKTTVIKWFFTN